MALKNQRLFFCGNLLIYGIVCGKMTNENTRIRGDVSMIYSNLYRQHYPFKSASDISELVQRDRSALVKYIKKFPSRTVLLHLAEINRKYPNHVINEFGHQMFRDVSDELELQCATLVVKILRNETLTADELDSVNCVLQYNKYNWLISSVIMLMAPVPNPLRCIT